MLIDQVTREAGRSPSRSTPSASVRRWLPSGRPAARSLPVETTMGAGSMGAGAMPPGHGEELLGRATGALGSTASAGGGTLGTARRECGRRASGRHGQCGRRHRRPDPGTARRECGRRASGRPGARAAASTPLACPPRAAWESSASGTSTSRQRRLRLAGVLHDLHRRERSDSTRVRVCPSARRAALRAMPWLP